MEQIADNLIRQRMKVRTMHDDKPRLLAENHLLGVETRKYFEKLQEKRGIDRKVITHGWIIAYLYHETTVEKKNIYQKDIEKTMHLPRSTATTILQKFEREDLIRRVFVEGDARLKKIELTEKGVAFYKDTITDFEETEARARRGITEEEYHQFMEILNKMRSNFKKEEC